MKDTELSLLKQIADSLQELVTWTRVASYPMVRQILEITLDTEDKRLVYQLTDGEHSIKAIQEETAINVRYISEWWQEWDKIGIVKQSPYHRKGRRRRLFDLTLFDLSTIAATWAEDQEDKPYDRIHRSGKGKIAPSS